MQPSDNAQPNDSSHSSPVKSQLDLSPIGYDDVGEAGEYAQRAVSTVPDIEEQQTQQPVEDVASQASDTPFVPDAAPHQRTGIAVVIMFGTLIALTCLAIFMYAVYFKGT